MNKFLITTLALTSSLSLLSQAEDKKNGLDFADGVPEAFTANCAVCHLTDRDHVGPSLAEIAKLYPEKAHTPFIKWCVAPGRKRPDMVAMPGQAHIPKEQLKEIHAWIAKNYFKTPRVRTPQKDEYLNSPTTIARPRITRTFLPNTGPASMVIALPTSEKHNFIWDTDKCELRYISIGEVDNYPYLRSNGNSLANPGKTLLTVDSLFGSSQKPQFMGYTLDKDNFPTLIFKIGNTTYKETYTVSGKSIKRVITSSASLPDISKIKGNDKLEISTKKSNKAITLTYKSL